MKEGRKEEGKEGGKEGRKEGRKIPLSPPPPPPPPLQLVAGIRGKIEFIPICKYFPLKCPFSLDINWTELPLPAGAGKPVSIN